MGGACSTRGGVRNVYKILVYMYEENKIVEVLGICGRIIVNVS
jgi:hypothetical protein